MIDSAEHYHFNSSLLDVAASGLVRLLIFSIIYSAMKVTHVWPVVSTTVAMSVFLITKVYFYLSGFVTTWDYVIFGAAFLLSFLEAGFYITRVASRDKQLDLAIKLQAAANPVQPLGVPVVEHPLSIAIASRKSSRAVSFSEYASATSDIESDAFGTPDSRELNAIDNSLDDDSHYAPSQRQLHLTNLGADAVKETWELATGDSLEWQLDIDTPDVSVWSTTLNDRRVIKSEGLVHVSPSILFHMLHQDMTAQAEWNPIINKFEVIEEIDRYTDLTYTVTSSHAGGMISPRDFVSVRQWLKRDGNMVISETSIEHPDRPPSDEHIRGQLGPGGYVLLSVPDQPHITNVIWIFNADLKGWLPRYLVDQTLANLLMRHHECMREELQLYNPNASGAENLYV